jgi:hypothetical protein
MSFHRDAFDTEGMDEKKMTGLSFGAAALGVRQPALPCKDTKRLGCPALALGQTQAPLDAGAACLCPKREAGPRPHMGTPDT